MGNMQADDYANGVKEGWASLRQAVAANLQSNHFPAIPLAYVGPVMRAIEMANAGNPTAEIDITAIKETGMVPKQAYGSGEHLWIDAAVLLDITHCWSFCDTDDDEEN